LITSGVTWMPIAPVSNVHAGCSFGNVRRRDLFEWGEALAAGVVIVHRPIIGIDAAKATKDRETRNTKDTKGTKDTKASLRDVARLALLSNAFVSSNTFVSFLL
jgi:hypothetical protein